MITTLRLLCLFGILHLSAQEIKISNFRVNNQQVNFDVTIEPKHSDRERYTLKVFHSGNNYTRPISYQLKDLVPNRPYKASFDGGNEIGAFEGDIIFRMEIEASRYPIELTEVSKNLKIGKNTKVSWFDYHEEGPYDVQLYQGQELSTTLAEGVDGTNFSGKIPKSLDKGDYSIMVIPQGRSELNSERIPVLLKKGFNPLYIGGGVLLAGGVVGLAAGGGGEGGPGGGADGFADPPGPPSGN